MNGTALALLATGVVVGALSGLLGIGGAILLVPALMFLFGFPQARAQGTSIGALIPPIGIFAAIAYYRNGLLDVRAAALIAAGFAVGALFGATLVPHVPQVWLKRVFASLLIYVAAQMMFGDPSRRAGAALPGAIAVATAWVVYGVRRALGQRARRPPPHPPETDQFL
jgi:hypothetical protein